MMNVYALIVCIVSGLASQSEQPGRSRISLMVSRPITVVEAMTILDECGLNPHDPALIPHVRTVVESSRVHQETMHFLQESVSEIVTHVYNTEPGPDAAELILKLFEARSSHEDAIDRSERVFFDTLRTIDGIDERLVRYAELNREILRAKEALPVRPETSVCLSQIVRSVLEMSFDSPAEEVRSQHEEIKRLLDEYIIQWIERSKQRRQRKYEQIIRHLHFKIAQVDLSDHRRHAPIVASAHAEQDLIDLNESTIAAMVPLLPVDSAQSLRDMYGDACFPFIQRDTLGLRQRMSSYLEDLEHTTASAASREMIQQKSDQILRVCDDLILRCQSLVLDLRRRSSESSRNFARTMQIDQAATAKDDQEMLRLTRQIVLYHLKAIDDLAPMMSELDPTSTGELEWVRNECLRHAIRLPKGNAVVQDIQADYQGIPRK